MSGPARPSSRHTESGYATRPMTYQQYLKIVLIDAKKVIQMKGYPELDVAAQNITITRWSDELVNVMAKFSCRWFRSERSWKCRRRLTSSSDRPMT
ncbi:hypothetical protein EVAR_95533_1 [Eumeta japonica]|uniref:Uncharacterized protein n=1 Tax=Eumeta variegata TaxID=151549 RepID=A0A4C1UJL3_EUMVA|nr:hypothetical protein EVAR_95533_1 [Eumeta japonica]